MTYSVKTIYPEFKCLTAHRAVMKRIETAGNNIYKKYCNFKVPVTPNLLYEALKIRKSWEWKRRQQGKVVENIVKNRAFYNIYKKHSDMEDVVMDTYRKHSNYGEIMKQDRIKRMKECPFMYQKVDDYIFFRDLEDGYIRWIRYEVWKSAKMENFYEAMISRDYKAVTLNDDVVREIFEYL
jgi:hypothetical protein